MRENCNLYKLAGEKIQQLGGWHDNYLHFMFGNGTIS